MSTSRAFEAFTGGGDRRAFVADVRRAVDARLEVLLTEAIERARVAGRDPAALADSIASLVRRGGKRLRPALTWAAACACVPDAMVESRKSALIDAGSAWELLQAFLLIHDDWMDGDAVRRGGPAVHVLLTQHHRGDAAIGAASAILAGDLASALAQKTLATLAAAPRVVVEAMQLFARVQEDVILGQALDLTLGVEDAEGLERMHALKTGSYTVRGPLLLGATIVEASEHQKDTLERFAAPLGIAFQLRDDLLGAFGSQDETGKPVGNDLRARKRTALVVEALRLARPDDATRLRSFLTSPPNADASDVDWTLTLIDRCGARASVEARIESLSQQGLAALDDASITDRGRAMLTELAAQATRRSR